MSETPAPASRFPEYVVETWAAERLKVYDRNARKHPPQQLKQLRGSFQKYGQVWPILVRPDGTIIAGHGRFEAAKAEGYTQIRVIVAAGWDEDQCRAFGLLDNQVPENAEWDKELLGVELSELRDRGIDLSELGFDIDTVDEMLAPKGTDGLTDPDDVPDAPAIPVSRPGDLWLLGRHRLLCGDSTKSEDVSRALGGVKPHLMVTDPPLWG